MLDPLAPCIGGIAAFLASLSYVPQIRKAWPRGSADDLSRFMLATLPLGLGLWIIYGSIRGDWMIVAANGVGATLAAIFPAVRSAILNRAAAEASSTAEEC
ncbi:SemiSWEET family sugar transporter [Bradyrhizobium sp. 521_C7_N1_3]|uniref:SemiSWEET family sugar transporter n=1 Tax=Bradyrhizobium sp. 521_C7_N1_3 TaxID=3240368 RepID=UPI003F8C090E